MLLKIFPGVDSIKGCLLIAKTQMSLHTLAVYSGLGHPFTELYIMKTRLFKYTENFTTKNWKFSDKNSDIFHISAQNIDCEH